MAKHPKLNMSRLRDIGWSLWDPIGLLDEEQNWRDVNFADEYDSYLMKVAGMLRNGESENQAAEYLVWVNTVHMGMSSDPDKVRDRADRVVRAIRDDGEIWS